MSNVGLHAEIDRDFAHITSADRIMQTVGSKIGAYMNVETCSFCDVDDRNDEIRVTYGWHKAGAPDLPRTFRISQYCSQVFTRESQKGETIIVRDALNDPRTRAQEFAALNIRSFLTVPLMHGTEWRSSLVVTTSGSRGWRLDEIELFRELADRIFPRIERARAEEALRKSEEKFRLVLEGSQDIIYRLNVQTGRFDYISPSIQTILGFTQEEIMSQDILTTSAMIHPEDRETVQEAVTRLYETGQSEIEYREQSKNGEYRWLSNRSSLTRDGSGNPLYLNGDARDITERKLIEEKLKKYNETLEERVRLRSQEITSERQRFYDVLETLPIMVCLLTRDYHVIFANRHFRDKFGESDGRRCFEYCYNQKEPCDFCESYNVFKTGKPHRWEATALDGTIIDVNDFPFTDADGSELILEMDIDITGQRHAESELKKHREHLQKLNDDLLRSNRELESFAYVTSHDLQEPLRMVTSFTQLLAQKYRDQLDDSAKEYVSFIVEGAKRMYDLINGLLAYSRISRKEITFSKVDTNNVLETVRTNLDLVIKERNCTIEADRLPVVTADYHQMIQLFQNLIANAIKFSRSDPGICISSKTEKTQYLFSIKDDGIGIEAQYFERIFEIFKRLNPRDQFEGTGIGLSICKRIVENHKGKIWVESEPGKGSVFYFTLPRE